jgi:Flp pilus assembly protein TadG
MIRRKVGIRGDRGAAAVEFALLLPVLLLVVIGLIDAGRGFSEKVTVTQLSREAARQAAVGKDPQGRLDQLAAELPPGVTATVSIAGSCTGSSPSQSVSATVSAPFVFTIGFTGLMDLFGPPGDSAITITATHSESCN